MTRAATGSTRGRTRRTAFVATAAALVSILVASLAAASPSQPTPSSHATAYRHVVIVVMENLSYGQAQQLPGYVALAHRYASASDDFGVSHPSLPNYLAMTGGSTFGVTSDCTRCFVHADNLGAQLSDRGVSWDDFSEGLPHRCYLGDDSGLYAGKHNPFRYYDDVRSSPSLCSHLLGLSSLTSDLRDGAMPSFSFVTPNLCHDGHSCAPARAMAWLSSFVRSVTAMSSWRHGGLLVVTWDEGATSDTSSITPSRTIRDTGGGGHIPTLLVAPGVPRGAIDPQPLNGLALLATIESNFGLPHLAGAGAWTDHTLVLP